MAFMLAYASCFRVFMIQELSHESTESHLTEKGSGVLAVLVTLCGTAYWPRRTPTSDGASGVRFRNSGQNAKRPGSRSNAEPRDEKTGRRSVGKLGFGSLPPAGEAF